MRKSKKIRLLTVGYPRIQLKAKRGRDLKRRREYCHVQFSLTDTHDVYLQSSPPIFTPKFYCLSRSDALHYVVRCHQVLAAGTVDRECRASHGTSDIEGALNSVSCYHQASPVSCADFLFGAPCSLTGQSLSTPRVNWSIVAEGGVVDGPKVRPGRSSREESRVAAELVVPAGNAPPPAARVSIQESPVAPSAAPRIRRTSA